MTALLAAEFQDENGVRRTLTHEEILTYVTVVTGAGNETTGRRISWITLEGVNISFPGGYTP
jgi:cytochrome P450